MKTYALNCLDRIKQYSKQLDAKTILHNKNWEVFNDAGEKEMLVFKHSNELLIIRNGIVHKYKWELLNMRSLLIETGDTAYYLNAAFIASDFLILQLDGTEECMILIETGTKKELSLNSIEAIENNMERYREKALAPKQPVIKPLSAKEKIICASLILLLIIILFTLFNN